MTVIISLILNLNLLDIFQQERRNSIAAFASPLSLCISKQTFWCDIRMLRLSAQLLFQAVLFSLSGH